VVDEVSDASMTFGTLAASLEDGAPAIHEIPRSGIGTPSVCVRLAAR